MFYFHTKAKISDRATVMKYRQLVLDANTSFLEEYFF